MGTLAQETRFMALDKCHQQMHKQLVDLAELLIRLRSGEDDAQLRRRAGAIEAFFSVTSRQHHVEEEQKVFPALLASDNAELVQAVCALQQDHLWIEFNWAEIAPMLRALSQGEDWVDQAELQHAIDVFVTLCN
ncbi:MAG: hemerythrin domain-containing protein, partial [Rhodoferax sp.]|nr:hemerythrin domain-containing protein [Rhodoferax sp.]